MALRRVVFEEITPRTREWLGEERITGSLRLSYDGDTRLLLIDGMHLSIRRVEYDIELEAAVLLSSRLPRAEWLCQILRTGRFIYPA